MPSLLERARRVRHHDNTDIPAAAGPTTAPAAGPGVVHPDPAISDPAGSDPAIANPTTPQPDNPASDVTTELTAPQADPASSAPIRRTRIAPTRISGAWVAVVVAVVALVFLLIFILQNLTGANVYFLGAAGALPMGVAMLLATVAGALLIALFGSARILQLRRTAHRRHH